MHVYSGMTGDKLTDNQQFKHVIKILISLSWGPEKELEREREGGSEDTKATYPPA